VDYYGLRRFIAILLINLRLSSNREGNNIKVIDDVNDFKIK